MRISLRAQSVAPFYAMPCRCSRRDGHAHLPLPPASRLSAVSGSVPWLRRTVGGLSHLSGHGPRLDVVGPSALRGNGHERAAARGHHPHPEMGRPRTVCRTGPGLCCCTGVPDPGGLSFHDTDGCGERTFRPSPGASPEGTGWVPCPVAQALGPALVPSPPYIRPCRQRAKGAGKPGVPISLPDGL